MFRKYVTALMMFFVLAVGLPLATASSANAQTRRYYSSRTHRYVYYKKPNFYRRHRKLVNIGAGTAAGAIVGGLIGGRRGAGIGALAGAGTGYVVTKRQRPKHYTRRYYVYRRP